MSEGPPSSPRPAFVLDLSRCIGCWACAIACKSKNGLAEDVMWIRVETVGGTERDTSGGVFPDVTKHYRPDINNCSYTAADLARGDKPSCAAACPVDVFLVGDASDADSPVAQLIESGRTSTAAVQPRHPTAPDVYSLPPRSPEAQRRSGNA